MNTKTIFKIYKFNHHEHTFLLTIYNRNTRFNGEGILQNITLTLDNREMYRDTFGCEKTLDFLISELDINIYDIGHNSNKKTYCFWNYYTKEYITIENDDYDQFINWLKDSLTPINKKRIYKIDKILNNIYQIK